MGVRVGRGQWGGREGVLWLGLNGGGKSLVGFNNIFGVPYNSVKS